jgi:serine/threonine protein phosphatase 1
MFRRLFGSGREKAGPPSAVPAGTCVYAVGDIHGRADLLSEMHGLILSDAAASSAVRRVVVYLGDYVDRGLESRQVVDLLLDEPLAGFESIHLKGNHEEFMLVFLEDTGIGPGWLNNGGNATLYSYGVGLGEAPGMAERLEAAQADLSGKLPPRHLRFLESLRLTHEEGDYLFVHAGIRPGIPLESQKEEDMLWIRDAFLDSTRDHGKIVVHGHSITPEPEVLPNRIGIDTGAFSSGTLTCLVLEGSARDFILTG